MNWKDEVAKFKTELKAEPPVISSTAIRFGFFGTVGGGKSVTAGIFAVGITPQGLIGWIDGEGKRSGWAIDIVSEMAAKRYGGTADDFKQRFKVVHIDPPFNPLRVVAATELLEEMGCKTIIEDVLTQAWDSEGGYLDLKDETLNQMAGDDESKRQRSAAAAAARVKPWTHKKLVDKITTSRTNIVLLFQAKQKFNVQTKKPDDFESPIQESGLTRTAIAVGHVHCNDRGVGGFCNFELGVGKGTKYTHHSILEALPKAGQQFGFEHAEAILALCGGKPALLGKSSGVREPPAVVSAGTPGEQQPKQAANKVPDIRTLKAQLWQITTPIHNCQPGDSKELIAFGAKALNQWLIDEGLISETETLAELNEERLRQVIRKVELKQKAK